MSMSFAPNVHTFVVFHVDVSRNTNASVVCEIQYTYLLTYLLPTAVLICFTF